MVPGALLEPEPAPESAPPGRLAIADVERSAGGRRGGSLLLLTLLPAERFCLSLPEDVPAAEASSSSAIIGGRMIVGVDVFVESEVDEAAEAGSEREDDDCERWRIERSVGLLRLSWFFEVEERWPGVCDRGIGGARSGTSSASSSSIAGGERGSAAGTGAILCDRMMFMSCGKCGCRSRPTALAWSAIVGSNDHIPDIDTATTW